VSSSILIIGLFELANISYHSLNILFIYSLFAFIINLLREIIKDIEDIEGDISLGLNTLPILIGRQRTNSIVLILCIAFTVSIVMVLFTVKELEIVTRIYGSLFVVLPTVYFISKLYTSKTKKDYTRLSSLLKIIVLLGMGTIFTL
jgi:4-hydroxybenzoate polyprenyltransferase